HNAKAMAPPTKRNIVVTTATLMLGFSSYSRTSLLFIDTVVPPVPADIGRRAPRLLASRASPFPSDVETFTAPPEQLQAPAPRPRVLLRAASARGGRRRGPGGMAPGQRPRPRSGVPATARARPDLVAAQGPWRPRRWPSPAASSGRR